MKTDFKLRQKKFALLLLSLLASLIVGLGFIFSPQPTYAAEGLKAGTLVAQDSKAVVIKDTICVKRWEECKFSLYYMGDFEDVFVAEIHNPVTPISTGDLTFSASKQIITSYSVSSSVSKTVTEEMEINSKISVEEFMVGASGKAISSSTAAYAAAVGLSNTDKISFDYVIHIDGEKNPLNKVYGDLLMINYASKYKLAIYKEVRAKHRSSALSKWGAYQVESTQNFVYDFYAFNTRQGGYFYQMIGMIGTKQDYSNVIHNAGK